MFNIKITIYIKDKEYSFNFNNRTPREISEELKRHLIQIEKLNLWQQKNGKK